ncbi:hypothetical protein IW143_006284, partial [Coemansia sp. RSA 520]
MIPLALVAMILLALAVAASFLEQATKVSMMAQKVLDKASKERTTLMVVYRLSMIQDCNMIVVFKNCRIVERSTHDELLALKGTY